MVVKLIITPPILGSKLHYTSNFELARIIKKVVFSFDFEVDDQDDNMTSSCTKPQPQAEYYCIRSSFQ